MDKNNVMAWMEAFTTMVNENKDYLSELDAPIGDGDHGMNMARGTTEMMLSLKEKNPATPSEIFKVAAMTLISKVGGASGPLYGSAFLGMSKCESEETFEIINSGLDAIIKRGQAHPGEKTMVDTWASVVEMLQDKKITQDKIMDAAKKTADLKATKGRASYLGERSIGHIDPGAMSSAYLFTTMLDSGIKQ